MNGRSVRLWQDKWFLSIPAGKLTPIGDVRVSRNMRVSTMISETSGNWDIDAIKPLISVEDCDAIQDTCIGDILRDDRIVWPANRNGKYSVEFVEHLLLSCPWVEPIWFGDPLNYRVNRTNVSNLPAWVSSFFGSNLGSKEELARILSYVAFTCWHIWKARCNFVFDNKSISPNQVIMSIFTSVNGFLGASRTPEGRSQRVQTALVPPACWSPPSPFFMKLNVDAS
ncbi:uncharacterized protein [Pyrus communis]|uniref:uncharacterized protein n=1 Tax=Pyrus communis TaxID=23211 RepID=UPI0035C20B70